MQLTRLTINGLFGRFDHDIPLTANADHNSAPQPPPPVGPSVVILHGENGVGKTTSLRMIEGLLKLRFNVFRAVPFRRCTLRFDTDDEISVAPAGRDAPFPLDITFQDLKVRLHPFRTGAAKEADIPLVEAFRQRFFAAVEPIDFSLLDAERFLERSYARSYEELIRLRYGLPDEEARIARLIREREADAMRRSTRRTQDQPEAPSLAARVSQFVARAQADYRAFFTFREPDLFARIISQLEKADTTKLDPSLLISRLSSIHALDEKHKELGLSVDRWNFSQLREILSNPGVSVESLNVIAAYTEVLESRANERNAVSERLVTFERLMAEFYSGLTVRMNEKDGFHILAASGERLLETQLSSGEYHLLYLMVTALITRRRGTVIAIDEPELSMHIAWQRKLVRALVECSSGAEPQFIFATHSPDLVAEYRDAMVRLGPQPDER